MQRLCALLLALPLLRVGSLNASAAPGGLFLCSTACGDANNTQLSALISSFNAALALALRAAPPPLPATSFMLLNARASAALSFITLSGAWDADEALYIPRQVVLALSDGAEVAATPQLAAAAAPGNTVVFANGSYSALVAPGGLAGGARITCGGLPVRGVFNLGAGSFVLDGVTVEGCGGSSANCSAAVHFVGAPMTSVAEVARTRIVGGCRGIWLQMFGRTFIHHSEVLNSTKFGIDWDSYAGPGLVWANTVSNSGYVAVFLEQGASYVTVVGNTISSSGQGVATYPYQWSASPTANFVIAGNNVTGCGYAFSTGSTRGGVGNVTWLPAQYVSYIGNTIGESNRVGFHANGPQQGVVFLSNDDAVGFDAPAMGMAGSAAAIDPLGRAQLHSSAIATPSRTRSPSRPPTRTVSPTPTPTPTPSLGAPAPPPPTPPVTPTPSSAPSASATPLPTPTPCATPSASPSPTPTPTSSLTLGASPSATGSARATLTPLPAAQGPLLPAPSPAACANASGGAAAAAASAAACVPCAPAAGGAAGAGLLLGFLLGALAFRRQPAAPLATAWPKGATAAPRLRGAGSSALVIVSNPHAAHPGLAVGGSLGGLETDPRRSSVRALFAPKTG